MKINKDKKKIILLQKQLSIAKKAMEIAKFGDSPSILYMALEEIEELELKK